MHKVTFKYFDEEALPVLVEEENLPRFLECVGKGEVFYNETSDRGIWVPIDKVRFFVVEKDGEIVQEGDAQELRPVIEKVENIGEREEG